jgi:mannose-6-phosphate isomerase
MPLITKTPFYPLRFDPIYQYRPWGGRRLTNLLSTPLPGDDPIGEAWLLSDRNDHVSIVSQGALKGSTLRELMQSRSEEILGRLSADYQRFPLLLKFLDVQRKLSVQVHPADSDTKYIPDGETGKTEAWVVLETGKESRIYAGLKPGTTKDILRKALTNGTLTFHLSSFVPKLGDGVLIPADTVHSLSDVVVFEVQENSDVTFRLYDWENIDPKTGAFRPLQVEEALACLDITQGEIQAVQPVVSELNPVLRERLVQCDHFGLWQYRADLPFSVGAAETPRVLVCIDGEGHLEPAGGNYAITKGDVLLLPAILGTCLCHPHGGLNLLEISLPESIKP